VLWLSGLLRRELALISVVLALPILVLTHTRTALVALLAGVLIAGLSLFTARSRARKLFAAGLVIFSVGALTLSSVVATWLARGQDTTEVAALTGRRAVWDSILDAPRSTFETLFGFGLSNKSFNGLPIDSNWLGTYYDIGLIGMAINVAMVLFVLIAAWFQPQGPRRALALFLVAYCLVASFTESGLSDASPYLLELTLAASLVYSGASREGVR
jgi:O-antigen ligase